MTFLQSPNFFITTTTTMVVLYNKQLLSSYLITLKVREIVGSSIPKPKSQTQVELVTHHHRQKPEETQQDLMKKPDSEWVISIKEKLETAQQDHTANLWVKLCIYHVPNNMREGNERSYAPQIVSLGPYHHGKKRLRQMDCHKWRSLHHVLNRTNQNIEIYLDSIRELEEKSRSCYEGPITMSSDEFVEMMVLDGCFMIELFRGVAEGFEHMGYARNDPVFAMRGLMHSIQRDMIMLENQIPLFVLEKILEIQLCSNLEGLVARLAVRFFDPLMPTDEPLTTRTPMESTSIFNPLSDQPQIDSSSAFDPLAGQPALHCLDVFRRSLLFIGPLTVPRIWIKRWSNINLVADRRRQQLIHCVTELRESGVQFKKRKTDRFWDIKFENGVLQIPRLLIHDGTKSLLLNLIAFEQCHLDCSNNISSYVIFMDNLINSASDVRYLHYCGIIEHWLGSDDEVADLFNRLCQEVAFDINDSYLSKLSEDINMHYNYKWNSWRATLTHKYFNSPWASISVMVAIILLVFTFAQAFYGVYAYYRPR